MEPKIAADYPLEVGENPIWNPIRNMLFWTDIPRGTIYCFDPISGQSDVYYRDTVVGGFTIQEDGSLLLFGERGSVKILEKGKTRYIIEEIPEERDTRFNDVIADPEGRVFCGTMPSDDHHASVYRLECDGTIERVIEGVGLSNGMGFSTDGKLFYHTDTYYHSIYVYTYDQETGSLSDRRVFAVVSEDDGNPDGLTVDADDYVWSARWGGSSIVRLSPYGELTDSIYIPVRKVTSLTFGGRDYMDIFVTTAGGDNREEEGDFAGSLLYLRSGIEGKPEFLSTVGL
jgi:D-xylonolactonase